MPKIKYSPHTVVFGVQNAVCCAHLLCELTGIIENYPAQIWAKKIIECFFV